MGGLTLDDMPELPSKEDSDAPSPGRSKPIPKPDREVTKGDDGRFVCTWVGCTEDVRAFNRKCEWSKHMDKHDRPYKCPSEGCEKLPGFTYWVDCYGISERYITFTVAPENNSIVLTRTVRDS